MVLSLSSISTVAVSELKALDPERDIEITVPVRVTAGLSFWMPAGEWQALTDDQKVDAVSQHIANVQRVLDRDGMECGSARMYAVIEDSTPDYTIYDPEAEA